MSYDDELARSLLASLRRLSPPSASAIESYNKFIEEELPHVVREHSLILHQSSKFQQEHQIVLEQVSVGKPNHEEKDGIVRNVTPLECRQRNLMYWAPVFVTIRHRVFKYDPESELAQMELRNPDRLNQRELAENIYQTDAFEVPLLMVPVMVGSRVCALHQKPRRRGECPMDTGGYFLCRGNEKCIINQERLATNRMHLFAARPSRQYATVEVRSCHENKLRSTSTLNVSITHPKVGTPNITVRLPFLDMEIPLVVVFRLLLEPQSLMRRHTRDDATPAVCREEEELATVIRHPRGPASLHDQIAPFVLPPPPSATPGAAAAAAAAAEDEELAEMRVQLKSVLWHPTNDLSVRDLFLWVGENASETERSSGGSPQQRKIRYITHLLSNELLPQCGYDRTLRTRTKKARYLGLIARRLLRAYVHKRRTGEDSFDDRDDYADKRVATPGTMLGLLFRQLFRQFTRTLRLTLFKAVEGGKTLNVADAVNIRAMTNALRRAMSTGQWSVPGTPQAHNSVTTVGVTQMLSRINAMSVHSQLTRVSTPVNRDGKATDLRMLHASHYGIFCPSATPEGHSCGLIKELSVVCHVRSGFAKEIVEQWLALTGWCHLHCADAAGLQRLWHRPLVFVNGDPVATVAHPERLVAEARAARRRMQLPFDLSIFTDADGHVQFGSDAGCLMRPLLIVSELPRLRACLAARPDDEPLRVALEAGILEYVDKHEERHCVVSLVGADLAAAPAPDYYTHLEIHPVGLLGVCASLIPHADRNQAPRNMYQASMGKQAVSMGSLAWRHRFDTQMHIPHYVQRPLTQTWLEEDSGCMECPNGTNVVLAVASMWHNQEDSLIMNRASVERGLFHSSYFTSIRAEEHTCGADRQKFGHPETTPECVGMHFANYDKIDRATGKIAERTVVEDGDVLNGIMLHTTEAAAGTDNQRAVVRDRSVVHHGKPCVVDRVFETRTRDGYPSRKIRLRTPRVPQIGDKFSSRHGQKGTIGLLMRPEDMPYAKRTGQVPDAIINPHAFPSRMTIGHLVEGVQSKAAALRGRFADGTPFRRTSAHTIAAELEALGYRRSGREVMVDGMTGKELECDIWVGLVHYQKLKHFVDDKIHARRNGGRALLTRQPVEGRRRRGGLRIGEMERDALIAAGASSMLLNLLCHVSDAYDMMLCPECGLIASRGTDVTLFGETNRITAPFCTCSEDAAPRSITVPYAWKLLCQETQALNICMHHHVDEDDDDVAAVAAVE